MSLYVVIKDNPFWPKGTWVKAYTDGVEKIIPGTENGHMVIEGHEGFVIPWQECEFCLMRVQQTGLDAGSARMDRRRRQARHFDQDAEMEEIAVTEMCDDLHERKLWPTGGL